MLSRLMASSGRGECRIMMLRPSVKGRQPLLRRRRDPNRFHFILGARLDSAPVTLEREPRQSCLCDSPLSGGDPSTRPRQSPASVTNWAPTVGCVALVQQRITKLDCPQSPCGGVLDALAKSPTHPTPCPLTLDAAAGSTKGPGKVACP